MLFKIHSVLSWSALTRFIHTVKTTDLLKVPGFMVPVKTSKSEESIAVKPAIMKSAPLDQSDLNDAVICRLCDQPFVRGELTEHRKYCRINQQLNIRLLKINYRLQNFHLLLKTGNVVCCLTGRSLITVAYEC